MSELSYSAATAVEMASAYTVALEAALGPRDPLEVLAETPAALQQAVAGLSKEQWSAPERPGKWAIVQVLQHLADSELISGFRIRMILAHDRPTLPGYDQDLLATRLHYNESTLATAVGDFTTLRQANLRLLRRASAGDFTRVMLHAERGEESLAKMVRLLAGHDVVHLRQITRIRAAVASA